MRGLGGFEAAEVRRRRKTICASQKFPFQWMRIDPCISRPEIGPTELPAIHSSRDASKLLHESVDFAGRMREFAIVLCMDGKNRPLAIAVPHIGGVAFSVVDPRSVLQPAILVGASGVIFAHNHPSGEPRPSEEDIVLTRRIRQGAKLVALELTDMLVLTDDPKVYFSFLDSGMMPSAG
jgi:DNA repair protein RadC